MHLRIGGIADRVDRELVPVRRRQLVWRLSSASLIRLSPRVAGMS